MSALPITLEDVESASVRIEGVVHRTPVVTSRTLDEMVGANVFLKCENLQRVGAFKFRGAYNAISRLSTEQLSRGVATYSSGNHAQATALASRSAGTTAVVLMPEDTPASKMAATRAYGAEVVTYDRYTENRVALGERLATDRGLTLVPPYDHPHVMAGQGTAALELLDEIGPLAMIAAPVGGGGLMAGCATAAKGRSPATKVLGVEPALGDDTRRSLAADHRVSIPVPTTIADGLAADTPGELTFAVNRRLVDDVAVVTDQQIRVAMRFAFERLKLVVEPSGAAALAAVMAGQLELPARIGVIISGGNIDAKRFGELLGSD